MSAMIYFILTGCYYVTFSPEAFGSWSLRPKHSLSLREVQTTAIGTCLSWHFRLNSAASDLFSQDDGQVWKFN